MLYSILYNSNSSLPFESEKGELVKCPTRIGLKNEISEAKTLAALKNHSEAERRRRERINGHFDTLRGLVPSNEKLDKATLLAEVISQVKELHKNAMESSKGLIIPKYYDEVKIEPYNDAGEGYGSICYKASICCGYTPEILSDLKQTLDALKLKLVRAEISTLGKRVKNVFVFICCKGDNSDVDACKALESFVYQALSSVLDKASSTLEYLPRTSHPNKRGRFCSSENSASPCNHESCSC
ncbi:PREDICTED: transcription factor bHLH30-like isoform X2 [Lupinus angustifolius]|uniref:transcription factor bHLH30-like isoform X2 n=1 Tax=Lupinus angustifolius TaxID=3871 RepID=UPI00092F67B9|nr:PREDICTED: transcription factor bHLH30-like isoform X2 [Lupinus angustifolius]